MSFLVCDSNDFLLKLMDLSFQSGLLLKDEISLSIRSLCEVVMDDLIFKKHLVFYKIFSELFFLFLRIFFELIEFFFKFLLYFPELFLLTSTESQLFCKKTLFVFEEVFSIEESFHFFAVSGYLSL